MWRGTVHDCTRPQDRHSGWTRTSGRSLGGSAVEDLSHVRTGGGGAESREGVLRQSKGIFGLRDAVDQHRVAAGSAGRHPAAPRAVLRFVAATMKRSAACPSALERAPKCWRNDCRGWPEYAWCRRPFPRKPLLTLRYGYGVGRRHRPVRNGTYATGPVLRGFHGTERGHGSGRRG